MYMVPAALDAPARRARLRAILADKNVRSSTVLVTHLRIFFMCHQF
jgi:hypothetical protein